MAVAVGHQFIGTLACGVKLQRMVNTLMLAKGHLGVCAINAAGRRISKMGNLVMATGLKDSGKSDDVAFHIGHWIDERVAHASLRRQVNHPLGPVHESLTHQRFIHKATP